MVEMAGTVMMVAKVQFYIKNETTGAQRMNFNNNNITPQYSTPVWFGNRNDSSDDPETFNLALYVSGLAKMDFEETGTVFNFTELILKNFSFNISFIYK